MEKSKDEVMALYQEMLKDSQSDPNAAATLTQTVILHHFLNELDKTLYNGIDVISTQLLDIGNELRRK